MKPRKTGPRADAERRLDALWSAAIRRRAEGRCEHCHTPGLIESAHVIPRRYRRTRWDPANGIGMRTECHRRFTDRPAEFRAWLESARPGQYDALWSVARETGPISVEFLADAERRLTTKF